MILAFMCENRARPGVPQMPFPDFTPTVPVLLRTAAERFGPRTFLVADGERLTYAEANTRSAAIACGLLARGIGKGSRVGILMPNSVDWALVWFAATRIGAIAVLLNTFYQAGELAGTVRHSDVSHVLASGGGERLARFEASFPGLSGKDAGRP